MINAHTATRTFREMQFDIKAFLYALYDIFPAEGHEDKGLVEIKWADGSVDIVPTFELVKGICNSTYMQLLIGGVAELIPDVTSVPIQNGKYYRDTLNLIIQSAPLKAHMEEIGSDSEDLEFIQGTIQKLVAETVELPSNAEISKMQITGKLYATECNVSKETKISTIECDEGGVKDYADNYGNKFQVDLSNTLVTVPMRVITNTRGAYDLSQYMQIYGDTVLHSMYSVTGQFRFGGTSDDVSFFHINRQNSGIFVEVPVYKLKHWATLDFDYVKTPMTKFNEDRYSPLPLNSPPAVTMLYPLKTGEFLGNGRLCIKLKAPTYADRNKIVNVQNPTGSYITVCNAWSFGEESQSFTSKLVAGTASIGFAIASGATAPQESSNYTGDVDALNTIYIPPYSAIDFLFTWEIKGGRLCAYMLPMTSKTLKEKG